MWFPYMRGELFFTGFCEINQILSECENEHDRIQRIDQMVFSFYTDERVQEIKEEWRDAGLPEHIYRIMSQSVDAYLRGEYAMTTIVLSSLWEGIVGQKATGEDTYKVSRKTKGQHPGKGLPPIRTAQEREGQPGQMGIHCPPT